MQVILVHYATWLCNSGRPQHTLQMFTDHYSSRQTIPWETINQGLLQPQGELYPIQTTFNHRSRDQLLKFCTSFYETISSEFLVQGNFKHTQFSWEYWYWRDSISQPLAPKASTVLIKLTWLPQWKWAGYHSCVQLAHSGQTVQCESTISKEFKRGEPGLSLTTASGYGHGSHFDGHAWRVSYYYTFGFAEIIVAACLLNYNLNACMISVHVRKVTHTKRNCMAGLAMNKIPRYSNSLSIHDGKMAATADSPFIFPWLFHKITASKRVRNADTKLDHTITSPL